MLNLNSYTKKIKNGMLSRDIDIVNKEDDDKGYEPVSCGEPQKSYKYEKYITNKELELVFRFF